MLSKFPYSAELGSRDGPELELRYAIVSSPSLMPEHLADVGRHLLECAEKLRALPLASRTSSVLSLLRPTRDFTSR